MGVLSTFNVLRSRDSRQRLPVYEPPESPTRSKERYSTEDDSSDSDDDSDYSEASSPSTNGSRQRSGSFGSGAPMLPRRRVYATPSPSRRPTRPYFYRLPNRIVRYLCVAMMMTILLFIFSLIRASQVENRRIANGEVGKAAAPPPPWQSFEFLTRYYGGVKSIVPFAESSPQYPREQDEQPFNTTSDSRTLTKPHMHPDDHEPSEGPLPPSRPFSSYPGSVLADRRTGFTECFLDKKHAVSIPAVRYFDGRRVACR